MSVNIPEGNNQVMPYLILPGAQKFLDFMIEVFGATEQSKHMNDDGTIMHAQIRVGECTIMFGDSKEPWPPMTAGMFIYVANADESYHKAIEAGGTTVMELSDQGYGRTCGVMDTTGNTWWITSV